MRVNCGTCVSWDDVSNKCRKEKELLYIDIRDQIPEKCNECMLVSSKHMIKENNNLRELLNEMYPSIAGLVIAAQNTGEVNSEKVWNEYCKKILKLLGLHK